MDRDLRLVMAGWLFVAGIASAQVLPDTPDASEATPKAQMERPLAARAKAPESYVPLFADAKGPGSRAPVVTTPAESVVTILSDSECATDCECEPVCGPEGRIWVRGEYLHWWTRGQQFPPLVTTSPLGTPIETAGLLGQPTTTILFGGEREEPDTRTGARLTAGFWLNQSQTLGIEGSYLRLENESESFFGNSDTNPILILPFFDETGAQRRRVTAFPGLITGSVAIDSSSRFNTWDVHGLVNVFCGCCCRVDALIGYRQLNLNEDLNFFDTEIDARGRRIDILDQFGTENQFHGADLGLTANVRRGKCTLDVTARVALGMTNREVDANGVSVFTLPGLAPVTQPGGFFVLPSNSGQRDDDSFTAIPELSVRLGYQLTCRLKAFVGYNFIYWADVARAGDQIDTTVNLSQLPSINGPNTLVGAARPAPLARESDFWAHGLSFGLELRY